MEANRAILLGTGTSTGIPMVGCSCPICRSTDPKDKRLRTSILIETKSAKIIVDTSPDLRQQLLKWNVNKIDAAIITHDHADHLHGIDDLRPFCFGPPKKQIPVYVGQAIFSRIENRFDYIFKAKSIFTKEKPVLGGGIPLLDLVSMPIENEVFFKQVIANEEFHFFSLPHGHTKTTGFIHKTFAYIPDCQSVSDTFVNELSKMPLTWLVIDCLQEDPHDTHLNVEMAFSVAKKVNAKNTRFIHMNHELSHQRLLELADKNFDNAQALPAYDNEELEY